MKDIHLYAYGSDLFVTLLKEIDLEYSIFFKNRNFLEDNSDLKDVIRIVFAEELKLSEFKQLLKKNIPTLIMLHNKNFLKENQVSILSFHQSLFLPIDIFSLREMIKIIITKHNFSKNSKTVIDVYELDINQKIISRDGVTVKLTEKELGLILALKSAKGLNKSFLLKKVWNYNENLESHAFESHLHRLRRKIMKHFKDSQFIVQNNSLYYLRPK
jgi:DNA-binding response OmpR family regulator